MSNPTACPACGGPMPPDQPRGFTYYGLLFCAACYFSDSPEVQDRVEAAARDKRVDRGRPPGQNNPR